MTAHLTPDERALIDAAIAAGKVTVVPIGATTAPVYQWQPASAGKPARLVQISGADISVRAQGRNALRAFRRPDVIAKAARLPRIRELAAKGMTRSQIAAEMGITLSVIAKDCLANGIVTPNPQTVSREKSIAKIRKLAAQGMAMKRIAKTVKREYGAVKAICAEHGITVVNAREAQMAKRAEAVRKAIAGQSEINITQVAADLGMTWITVKRYIAQVGA